LATYRKRLGKWQVQVRIKDKPAISKTFPTKELAKAWAITKERQILSSNSFEHPTHSAPLREIFLRYKNEITPYKKSSYSETYRISALLKSKIASLNTDSISKEDVAKHRDLRLRLVSKSTVRRELVLLRHILNVATHEWGYRSLCGLFDNIKFPKEAHHRVRRVSKDEIDAMWHALANQRNKNYLKAAQLALETGMRRSEILQLKVDDLQHDVIELKESKSGHPRLVPLTARSREILMDSLSKDKDELLTMKRYYKSDWSAIYTSSTALNSFDLSADIVSFNCMSVPDLQPLIEGIDESSKILSELIEENRL